ncbi:helix-turn-helix domain-containing protein [Nocardia sp. NPDC019395]|uniref:PucR family transcriptional regulator n=1 Tax=Nocardia sp. NPDC019395 TaxID=3154686 RepID=UPI0033C35593
MTVTADVHRPSDTENRPGGPIRTAGPAGADPGSEQPGRPVHISDNRPEIVRACTRLLAETSTDQHAAPAGSPDLTRLHELAADWIRHGGTAEAFHRAVRSAVDESLAQLVATDSVRSTEELLPTVRRFVRAHEAIARAVSSGLMRPLAAGADSPVPALRSLAAATAEGRIEALLPGARICENYSVLALTLHRHDPETREGAAADEPVSDEGTHRALHRMRLVLARDHDPSVLAALGVHGGTVLVPTDSGTDPDALVADLTAAADIPLIAIVAPAERTRITEVADTAHELLDLAQRLRYRPGLYRFRDLALEYQLTRPSPARTRLSARVAPLYDHPELLDTLLLYIRNRLRRQATAHILELHRNTVDYRLRRIQELTGFDPVQQTGLWYLQSGLIAYGYESDSSGQPAARAKTFRLMNRETPGLRDVDTGGPLDSGQPIGAAVGGR